MYNHNQTYAYRKFCVGQYAWVDWPSETFAGKDQDRQTRRIPVGRLDKKNIHHHTYNCICSDSDADFMIISASCKLSLINIKTIYRRKDRPCINIKAMPKYINKMCKQKI